MKLFNYLLLSATALAVPVTAQAASAHHGLSGMPVSDAELAQMHGKFVDGSKVMFFGITMSTQWQANDGHYHNVELGFNVSMNQGNFRPQLTLYRVLPSNSNAGTGSQGSSSIPSNNGIVVNDSLDNVNGLLQNIQVAGDSNSVLNDVTWQVTDQPISEPTGDVEQIALNGTQTIEGAGGAYTELEVSNGKIGYLLAVPNQGQVKQSIGSGSMRGLVQSTQLTGNVNSVYNQMRLQVQVSPVTTASKRNMRSVFSTLRGL